MAIQPDRRRWWSLLVVGSGVALVVVDITIVNVALPRVMGGLHLEIADGEWVNAAYALSFASLLVTLGRVGDAHGRRRLFVAGLSVFAFGSLVAARAEGLGSLLVGRAVQGGGAAMILPATLSIVNTEFRGRDRAIAFGIWGSLIAGMAAVGPLLGGWLTTTTGWRWVFTINLPVALLLAWAAVAVVPESRDPSVDGPDRPGAALLTTGLALSLFALIEGPRHGWLVTTRPITLGSVAIPEGVPSPVPLAFAAGIATLAGFVVVERRRLRRRRPVLFDLSLFRIDGFRIGNLLVTIVGLGEFGVVFVLPIYLQTVLGFSALATGVALLAMAAGGFLGGPAAAGLAHRIGPRQVVSLGMGLEAAGALGLALALGPTGFGAAAVGSLFIYGIGVGLASAQLTSVVLVDVPTAQSGRAAGMQSTFRQVGAGFGVAMLGSIFTLGLAASLGQRLAAVERLTTDQIARISDVIVSSAGWALGALRSWTPDFAPVADAAARAVTDAARLAGLIAAAIFVVGFVASRRLPDVRSPDRASARRQGRP